MKTGLLCSISLISLLGSVPVSAQTISTSDQASVAVDSDAIVVTARRRDENILDVPISVQVLNSESLSEKGVERVQDLERVVPTLRITPTSSRRNASAVELRGIGGVETSVTQDIAIAFYQNDVIQARPIGLNQSLFDVENVQVLLGPQGTLFGRNATAGAVLVTTRRPKDEFGAEIGASFGNYNRIDATGILNIPLGDHAAVRFAGQSLNRHGYTRNVLNGDDLDDEQVLTGRASLLVKPGGGFENLTVVDYYRSRSNGVGAIISAVRPCPSPPGTPGVTTPAATCRVAFAQPLEDALAAQQARGIRSVAFNARTDEKASAWGIANISTLELSDDLMLKNVFGYREINLVSYADHDATPLTALHVGPVTQDGWQISNELQLQGEFGNGSNWIVGAYYFHEEVNELSTSFQLGSPVSSVNNGISDNTNLSIFAQATWNMPFLPGVSLTAGGRYTRDDRGVELRSRTGAGACRLVDADNAVITPCSRRLKTVFNEPTWTVSLDYKPSDDVLLYIAHRRGYRTGGFNIRAVSPVQSQAFAPEFVTDVELGAKASWDMGGVKANGSLAVYKNWYSDIQRTVAGFLGGVLVTSVFNAAEAEIKGLEGNLTIAPSRRFSISGYFGYVDAVHTKFDSVVDGVPVTLRDTPFGISKYNLGASATWTPVDNDMGRVSGTVSTMARSSFYAQQSLPVLEPESRVGWQSLTNLTVDWEDIGGSPISAQFFVRNLFDADYVQSELAVSGAFGFNNRVYGEPRMYGLTVKYAFGGER